ncbi:hypothetical protein GCM10017714_29650 [Curtobacterium pusillum]|nr:hypothetical protein GCM10017610_25230 [Curtobacterium pusillum]
MHVRVGDEPLDDRRVRVLPHAVEQRVRGLVGDAVHHGRVLAALDRGELLVGEVDGTVVIARHPGSVGAAGDITVPVRRERNGQVRRTVLRQGGTPPGREEEDTP